MCLCFPLFFADRWKKKEEKKKKDVKDVRKNNKKERSIRKNKHNGLPIIEGVFDHRFIVWSPDSLGGKGSNLMRCLRAGFRVPPFIVLGSRMLRTFPQLQKGLDKLDEEASRCHVSPSTLARLRADVLALTLPAYLVNRLQLFMEEHHSASFAVRSSGISEDGSTAAFAGQYDTILNCRTEAAVKQAILQCWASQFADSVWAYADTLALHTQVGMAVVIQVQIDARAAGVAFSWNPVSSADTEKIVIEGAFGQGEAVVSGTVTPDSWHVRRSDGEICHRKAGNKPHKVVLNRMGGLETITLSRDEATSFCLSDKRVLEVAKVVRELEILRDTDKGVDMEWCIDMDGRLWVLQVRDITTKVGALLSSSFHSFSFFAQFKPLPRPPPLRRPRCPGSHLAQELGSQTQCICLVW